MTKYLSRRLPINRKAKTIRRFFYVVLAGLLLPLSVATAQDPLCLGVTQRAINTSEEFCQATGLHQACYGHILVDAQLQNGSPRFSQPGDITEITYLESIKLSAFNSQTGEWGIAKLKVQANLPSTNTDDVTILIFGDVQVENAVTSLPVDVTGGKIPLLNFPGNTGEAIADVADGSQIVATDRLPGTPWIRTELASGEVGWLDSTGLTSNDELDTLNEADADSPYYRPMQAFYFTSTPSLGACQAVPADGLIIQTPEGAAEVNFLINEVDIQIGSTAFLQAQAGGNMIVNVLDGDATITANGVQTRVTAGNAVSIPMSNNLSPTGAPSSPTQISTDVVNSLPLGSLDRPVQNNNIPQDIMDFAGTTGSGVSGSGSTGTTAAGAGSTDGSGTGATGGGTTGSSSDAPPPAGSGTGNGGGNSGGNNGNANGNGNNANGNANGNGNNGNGNANGNGNGNNGSGNGNGNGN